MFKTAIIAIIAAVGSTGTARAQYYNYGTGSNSQSNSVSGYYRDNGTYVAPYQRTNPDSSTSNNYGARGNYNPNNGRYGSGY